MELIEQLNEAKERDAGSGLSEEVSDHECARDVRKREHVSQHQVTEEFCGAENVFGLLERNRIKRHAARAQPT